MLIYLYKVDNLLITFVVSSVVVGALETVGVVKADEYRNALNKVCCSHVYFINKTEKTQANFDN